MKFFLGLSIWKFKYCKLSQIILKKDSAFRGSILSEQNLFRLEFLHTSEVGYSWHQFPLKIFEFQFPNLPLLLHLSREWERGHSLRLGGDSI